MDDGHVVTMRVLLCPSPHGWAGEGATTTAGTAAWPRVADAAQAALSGQREVGKAVGSTVDALFRGLWAFTV